jgi:L-lactate transport
MTWQQAYTPVAGSLGLSALCAALPIFTLLLLLGVLRRPAWQAALSGLAAALLVAIGIFGMPMHLAASAVAYGAAFGLFPISWVVFWAIFLYRLTLETGQFEVIKDSIASITTDRRLQALLIAFAFGAFVEGAAGFGTPVAVAAAMLTGLGFSQFYAAGICLLANTAPVAFGSIGIPVITLAGITGLPLNALSGAVGRICAPVSLFIPAYLVLVMGGMRGLSGVLPAAALCGIAFASTQYLVSNFLGPYLTDILGSLASIAVLLSLRPVWQPRDDFHLKGATTMAQVPRHSAGTIARAWFPYICLVVFVLLWNVGPVKALLNEQTKVLAWPGLHMQVAQAPPVTAAVTGYAARYTLNWLAASGTACMLAGFVSVLFFRVPGAKVVRVLRTTVAQLALPTLTVASVLGLAFLMNYCGATATLGLLFAATGRLFPFFSALLGWLGVFLTGSDTSANALFGNLQVVTANRLGLDPVLMAAANSSGGVMGKMISLQSIAVAAAATGMHSSDEARLFRFTLRHSVLLACVIGLVTAIYAHASP